MKEHDARLMEARFRDLLESSPDAIVVANEAGHIVLTNSQAENLFGYAAGELRGQAVDILLPERMRHAHAGHRTGYFGQPRKRAMGSGLDLLGRRKDGSEFPVEISLSPVQAEGRSFVMSAIRDSSERKRFERALQEKNDELARANLAKDRFLAGMSHELRTPLNAIIGFTGTLLMKLPGPLNAAQERQLGMVQSSGRHLLALINDLLDVATIEAGKAVLKIEPIEGLPFLEGIVATLRPQAEVKGLRLCLDMPVPVLWHTDRRMLTQIALNLASNAIKFTHEGVVTLRLWQGTHEATQTLALSVQDSGVGIPEVDQAKLFGAFSRVGNPQGTTGTGLGLYLSQKMAGLMGGSIHVVSSPGQGSTFTLRLTREASA